MGSENAKPPGAGRSWALIAGLSAVVALQPVACGPGEDSAPSKAVRALLADFWPEVVQPTLADASEAADALAAAAIAWDQAERAGDGSAERLAAQEAWRVAMARWQRAELLQIGPAGPSISAVGGLDLRDEVYSWPTVNPCRVDQETADGSHAAPDFFDVGLVNVMGLDALETVLFSDDATNACAVDVPPNSDGTWAALGADGVADARAAYAAALAQRVADRIDAIESAWEGGFDEDFAKAGDRGPFESPEEALNAVFDALFYLEIGTKDRKLGEPLGLRDCGAADCLHLVETPVAGGSEVWIRENLAGFRLAFTGGEGAGMDDLLEAVGDKTLSDAVISALDEADAAALALDRGVDQAAVGDPTEALALHTAIGAVTALLRGDVATVLLLQVPNEADGDND